MPLVLGHLTYTTLSQESASKALNKVFNDTLLMSSLTTDGSHTRIMFEITLVAAAAALVLVFFSIEAGTGLAQTVLPASQAERGMNATTECVGMGSDSESAANAQLNSNNNTITQECEQTISSSDGNGRNYATNTFDSNGESTGNQVDQQSDQRIGN
jgi:hypothetical protein